MAAEGGIRPRCVAMTEAAWVLEPRSPEEFQGWTLVTRAMSRAASEVPFIM